MKTRLIQEIGVRISLRRYWTEPGFGEIDYDCTRAQSGQRRFHDSMNWIEDVCIPKSSSLLHKNDAKYLSNGEPSKKDPRWPTTCSKCRIPFPDEVVRQVFTERLYDTPSGTPEPGDLYWANWTHWGYMDKDCCIYWDNCNDPRGHLYCILPNGHTWDIFSRCSNCTLPQDRQHRCWVLHEGPPLYVDKNGLTCSAGGGSIAVPGYHGFLANGELT